MDYKAMAARVAEIVRLNTEGKSINEIVKLVGLSRNTVKYHLKKALNPGPGSFKGIETSAIVRLRDEGKTYKEISELFNISAAGIKYHLRKANYANRKPAFQCQVGDPDEILRLQDAGKTYDEIAAILNVSYSAIKYHLTKARREDPTQLINSTIEYHRVKRIELETKIAKLQKELDWVKEVEGKLAEKMQLTVGQTPNGILLTKQGRDFTLTKEELERFLAAKIQIEEKQ